MSDLSNHRKKWTVKEVKQLMKEIRTMDIQNIAKIHKRTYSGIYFKLVREAVNIAEENPNIKLTELCDMYKLKTGYYRVKITSDDKRFLFAYSKENVYTNISLYHALKCKKTGLNINIELIELYKMNLHFGNII